MSSVDVAVGIVKGKIILKFPSPMEHIEFDSQNAIDIARAMTDAAFEIRDGVKPVGDTLKTELIERHRDTLIPRINLMLNSLREKKKVSNGNLSMQLIGTMLSEVFT